MPAYIIEAKEKQPLASRPKRTTGKHHKKRDHLCCRWTDELGEQCGSKSEGSLNKGAGVWGRKEKTNDQNEMK